MGYKIGDKVRFIGDVNCHHIVGNNLQADIKKYNNVFTIEYITDGYLEFKENRGWCIREDEIELIKEGNKIMKKNELKTGDIVTLRNGDKLIYNDEYEEFKDLSSDYCNSLSDLDDLNDNMTYDGDSKNDVIKVERPTGYETIFNNVETRKMTVAEICKELGYDVEIIKEEN